MVFTNASFDIRLRQAFGLAMAVVCLTALTGCGIDDAIVDAPSTYGSPATISGVVHGGRSPITYSTVKLYAAGTSGYGAGATLLATSITSNPGGSFYFTKNSTNGPSSGTGTTWACPATTADPIIYLISQGGNSLGNGLNDAADTNSAIALLDVIGPCSSLGGPVFVELNEISTIASVFALAPYINPGTTAGTEVIGTNGANVPTSKPQGALGLNNAVAAVINLFYPSTTRTGTSASTTAIQVTATPEAGKVNTMANILAACVNTATLPSANCTQLFNGAISTAGTKPVDTLQAAYYMATNPGNLGTQTTCAGSTTNIACLYNLPATTPPYQPTLTSQPTDWTIGITYSVANYSSTTGAGTCNSAGSGTYDNGLFFDAPTHAAIDANGNIWIINQAASGVKAAIVEMSPIGVPLLCVTPNSQTYGSSITIDPTGNVWGLFSHNSPTGLIQELPYVSGAVSTTPISYTPPGVSPLVPTGIVSDGYGNIFFTTPASTSTTSGGALYEYPSPGTSTTAVSPVTAIATIDSGLAMTFPSLAADSLGRIWGVGPTTAQLWSFYPPPAASITAFAVASNVVTFTAANTFTAGETAHIQGLSTTLGTQFNGLNLTIASANSTSFTANFTTANVTTTTDSGTATASGAGAFTMGSPGLGTTSFGLALSGFTSTATYIYTGTTCCGSGAAHQAEKYQSAATGASSTGASATAFLAGNIGARGVAVDGAGNMWLGQEFPESTGSTISSGLYAVAEMSAVTGTGPTHVTFTAMSPTGITPGTCATATGCASNGGFQKAAFLQPGDLEIDPSGNVWVLNTEYTNSSSNLVYVSGGTITEILGAATPIVTPLSVAAKNGTLGAKP